MKNKKKLGTPLWLEDLIMQTVSHFKPEEKEDLIEYAEKIKLEKSICVTCSKETYEINTETGEKRCIECKNVKKTELF